jgi:hypothetical protein
MEIGPGQDESKNIELNRRQEVELFSFNLVGLCSRTYPRLDGSTKVGM